MAIRFYKAITQVQEPMPADNSALGLLPTRAYRFCEALRLASGLGWYFYPPADLAFEWDGEGGITWWLNDEPQGRLTEAVAYPGFPEAWDAIASPALQGTAFPMMTPSREQANLVQIFTGWLVRTPPGYGALIRPLANVPPPFGYRIYEGLLTETDEAGAWFGPLFTNIELTKTDTRIRVPYYLPLLQLQLIERALRLKSQVIPLAKWTEAEWTGYLKTVVNPNRSEHWPRAAYASRVRQRAAGEP